MTFYRTIILAFTGLMLITCGSGKKAAQQPQQAEKVKQTTTRSASIPEKDKLMFDNYFFNGNKEKLLENYDAAIQQFQQALIYYPQNAAVKYLIGEIYFIRGNHQQALVWLEQAVKEYPDTEWYLALLAKDQSKLKKHIEAAETYKQLIKLYPEKGDIYFECANEYIYAKEFTKAIDVYNLMERKFGVAEEIIKQKEQLYLALDKPDKAIEELQKLLNAYPNEPRYMGMLAEVYMNAGKVEKAFEQYKKVLQLDPENGYAHFGLADYYRAKNDKDNMIRELKLAFADPELDPKSKGNVIISLVPLAEKDPALQKDITELGRVLANTHPEDPAAQALMGDLLYAMQDFQTASFYYLRCLEIDPASFNIWQQLCLIDETLKDYDALLVHSGKALELYPNQISLHYFQSNAHFRLKNYAQAIDAAEAGIAVGSTDAQITVFLYAMIGDANHELGKNAPSDQAYDKALEIDPKNTYVLNNYAYYLSLRKEKLEKAKEMSGLTITQEPGNASYLDTYGWILYQMKDYTEAIKYLARSLEASPDIPEVLEHMGDALYQSGDKEKALEYWKKATEKGTATPDLKNKISGKFVF